MTEQKQALQSLCDREARLHAILDAVPEAIITIDTNGIVTSYSLSSAKILGYTQSEILGNNVNMLMPHEHARHKSGELVPIHLKVSEVVIDDQLQFLGIIRDLTEEKEIR